MHHLEGKKRYGNPVKEMGLRGNGCSCGRTTASWCTTLANSTRCYALFFCFGRSTLFRFSIGRPGRPAPIWPFARLSSIRHIEPSWGLPEFPLYFPGIPLPQFVPIAPLLKKDTAVYATDRILIIFSKQPVQSSLLAT